MRLEPRSREGKPYSIPRGDKLGPKSQFTLWAPPPSTRRFAPLMKPATACKKRHGAGDVLDPSDPANRIGQDILDDVALDLGHIVAPPARFRDPACPFDPAGRHDRPRGYGVRRHAGIGRLL